MKRIIYLFTVFTLTFGAQTTLAAKVFLSSEVMVVAANNALELDVTMEMLDEDADSSSEIINILELPLQEMRREQLRNERRFRQSGETSPLRQGQGSANAVQGEINTQIIEAQQEAENAKRKNRNTMGQKPGR